MITTQVFSWNAQALASGVRRIVNMGGTSSSKSFSELQLAYFLLKNREKPTVISVVSESLPHLKKGVIADFEKILRSEHDYNEKNINKTDQQYFFGDNYIEFFSADIGKATGPRRNFLILNECNNIPYSIVEQLEMRTDEAIFYDFNPTAEFWIIDKVFTLPANEFALIKSNYTHNSQLPVTIQYEIKQKAERDSNFKRVHIDVEFGSAEGLIFSKFNLVDDMPATDKRVIGIDFGFTNDPTAMIDDRINNGEIWLDEICYQTGMMNSDIAQLLKGLGVSRLKNICDSQEAKSIAELSRMGINAFPCVKGAGSVKAGIDLMQQHPINITRRSVNLIKEFRNYKWATDKSGKALNEPVDLWNHGIDAARYATWELLTVKKMHGIRSHLD